MENKINIEIKDNTIHLIGYHRGKIEMPLSWFPRLTEASLIDLETYELSPYGIHWPTLDEDLSYDGFYDYTPLKDD